MKKIKILITLILNLQFYIASYGNDIKTIQYVIAHYNEDINWVYPYASQAHVYHKGSLDAAPDLFAGWTKLPNVGREGHTYLVHIINNYHLLADVTLFLQGRIADHACGKNVDDLLRETIERKIAFLGDPYHARYGCENYTYGNRGFLGFWRTIFNSTAPINIRFYPGACFGVTRELIHRHPIEFYRKILQFMSYDISPREGYHLERMWYFIFDPIAATQQIEFRYRLK